MAISIHYNFPTIKFLGISENNVSTAYTYANILYPSTDAAVLKYNDKNYFPVQLLIFTDTTGQNWCAVEARVNRDIDNNRAFFVMKLETGNINASNDIVNIIEILGSSTISDAPLNINSMIDTMRTSNAFVNSVGNDISIIYDKSVPIKTMPTSFAKNQRTNYDVTGRNMKLSVGGISAVLNQKALEWYIDCEMVGEHDLEKTIKVKVPKSGTQVMMENTLLAIVFVLATFAIYTLTPIIYDQVILPGAYRLKVDDNGGLPVKSITFYWQIVALGLMFTCFGFAFISQDVRFYMFDLFIGIVMVVIGKGVSDNFGNPTQSEIKWRGKSHSINPDFFALFKSHDVIKNNMSPFAIVSFGIWLVATILALDYRENKHKAKTLLVKGVEDPASLFFMLILSFILVNLSSIIWLVSPMIGFMFMIIILLGLIIYIILINVMKKRMRSANRKTSNFAKRRRK
jgi:hypothetical protein